MSSDPIFIVWKDFQRRVESFKEVFNCYVFYIHYRWEESNKLLKVLSYLLKIRRTVQLLNHYRPGIYFIQAPPTFIVLTAYIYSKFNSARYIVDAHNTLLYDSFWSRLPLTQRSLKGALTVIVHNEFVADVARQKSIPHVLLMDRPPEVSNDSATVSFGDGKPRRPSILVPCSFDVDEPIAEICHVTQSMPDVDFFITGHKEKLPRHLIRQFGTNTVFTGFLSVADYNARLRSADAVMVLTTRDGTQLSVASEAVSFLKPLIVTDFGIIRKLFPQGCVYVHNNASSIVVGIQSALMRRQELTDQMRHLREEKKKQWDRQFQQLQEWMYPKPR